MYIICGLGNPGQQYEDTRHNMGFKTLDVLSSRLGIPITKLKFKALLGEGMIGSEKVVLVKPQTYMNLSGEALRPIMDFYKETPDHLIVIYDDVDIPLGALRIRPSGSSGSHNGMKSVIYQLQYDNFPRIRVGLGDHGLIPLDKFVIGKVPTEDQKILTETIIEAADAAMCIVEHGVDEAMQKYNHK